MGECVLGARSDLAAQHETRDDDRSDERYTERDEREDVEYERDAILSRDDNRARTVVDLWIEAVDAK